MSPVVQAIYFLNIKRKRKKRKKKKTERAWEEGEGGEKVG